MTTPQIELARDIATLETFVQRFAKSLTASQLIDAKRIADIIVAKSNKLEGTTAQSVWDYLANKYLGD